MDHMNAGMEELQVGQTYTAKELKYFIAYDARGDIIFSRDERVSMTDEKNRFIVDDILEGYICRRKNDYYSNFEEKEKIYMVTRLEEE